jgi:hypothetical protein
MGNDPKITRAADDDDQIVWGITKIGQVIERTPRQALYMCQKGMLPVAKVGRQWVGGRRRIRAAVLCPQK